MFWSYGFLLSTVVVLAVVPSVHATTSTIVRDIFADGLHRVEPGTPLTYLPLKERVVSDEQAGDVIRTSFTMGALKGSYLKKELARVGDHTVAVPVVSTRDDDRASGELSGMRSFDVKLRAYFVPNDRHYPKIDDRFFMRNEPSSVPAYQQVGAKDAFARYTQPMFFVPSHPHYQKVQSEGMLSGERYVIDNTFARLRHEKTNRDRSK
ncbi:MAG: hypothetical protein IT497_07135 [Ottowia sp.]|nr:hypothetical protein [Ottowia sp.]